MLYLLYEKEANGERCQDAEIGKRKTLGHAIQHKPALNDSPNAETGVRHRSHKSPIMICKRDLTSIGEEIIPRQPCATNGYHQHGFGNFGRVGGG